MMVKEGLQVESEGMMRRRSTVLYGCACKKDPKKASEKLAPMTDSMTNGPLLSPPFNTIHYDIKSWPEFVFVLTRIVFIVSLLMWMG